MWRPNKEEIGKWLDAKEIKFFIDHNKNPWRSVDKCLRRYVFIDFHEIFFAKFSNIFAEWIKGLDEKIEIFHIVVPRNWTLELIRKVNSIRNRISRVVDYWMESVLGGYITEFSVDCT
jgi:hypothetical protein